MFGIFKSRERKLYERGVASGLSPSKARERSIHAARMSSYGRDHQDAYMATGSFTEAAHRANGARKLSGVAKAVYKRTGNWDAAVRAERESRRM